MNRLYLIHVYGDVDPYLKGPYKTEALRLRAARRIRHMDSDFKDGVFKLTVNAKGRPTVGHFTGGELESK